MATYLYRRGDGNEGNFIRAIVDVPEGISPYAALRALVLNDYIAGSYTRRYIAAHMEMGGEPEFGIYTSVLEGPRHATAFGFAWLTAELQPLSADDATYYRQSALPAYSLPASLDRGAKRHLHGEA